jgi:hypothetical protein
MMSRFRIPLMLCLLCAVGSSAPVQAQQRSTERFEIRKDPVSRGRAQLLSGLYPGLGQLVAGHRGKGTTMVVAHTGLLVVWLTAHADYNTHEEQFALQEEHYTSLQVGGSFQEAEETWQQMRQRKDDLDRSHLLRVSFGLLAAGLYSYNLVDVLLLDGVEPAPSALSLQPQGVGSGVGVALVARFD